MSENDYKCDECKECFPTPQLLKAHFKTHKGNPFECLDCKKVFAKEVGLKRHKRFCQTKSNDNGNNKAEHQDTDNVPSLTNFQLIKNILMNAKGTLDDLNELKVIPEPLKDSKKAKTKHGKIEASKAKNICEECEEKFDSHEEMQSHFLSVHGTPTNYQCTVCKKFFSRKFHLKRHQTSTVCSGAPKSTYPCPLCGNTYTRPDNMREHLKAHVQETTRPKKYKCEHCDKRFFGASLLKIHIRTHTGEKPFKCNYCVKSFIAKAPLLKHLRIHTGERPFNCPQCDLTFSLKGTLVRHMRVHTGVRPHKCQYCDKSFIQAGGLKAHMFFHTGENGFKCDLCEKTFNRKMRLQLHKRYVHEKIKPFSCNLCEKKFTRNEDLIRHGLFHSKEKKFECQNCHKSFSTMSALKMHQLTHIKEDPRLCHECGRAFIRKDCLLRHMRKNHRELLDKILVDETESGDFPDPLLSREMKEEALSKSIKELIGLLVDQKSLIAFGWPDRAVDELLEAVIRRSGHAPVDHDQYAYLDRLRENTKLLFTVVIDDNAVKTLLNNHTVDEVIGHVLRLAKS